MFEPQFPSFESASNSGREVVSDGAERFAHTVPAAVTNLMNAVIYQFPAMPHQAVETPVSEPAPATQSQYAPQPTQYVQESAAVYPMNEHPAPHMETPQPQVASAELLLDERLGYARADIDENALLEQRRQAVEQARAVSAAAYQSGHAAQQPLSNVVPMNAHRAEAVSMATPALPGYDPQKAAEDREDAQLANIYSLDDKRQAVAAAYASEQAARAGQLEQERLSREAQLQQLYPVEFGQAYGQGEAA